MPKLFPGSKPIRRDRETEDHGRTQAPNPGDALKNPGLLVLARFRQQIILCLHAQLLQEIELLPQPADPYPQSGWVPAETLAKMPSRTAAEILIITTGGTAFLSLAHCCAQDPTSTKASGKAEILRNSAIVNFRRSTGWTTEANPTFPPIPVTVGHGFLRLGLVRLRYFPLVSPSLSLSHSSAIAWPGMSPSMWTGLPAWMVGIDTSATFERP